jgi:NAD-dependent dihydropyrimidine dehydrogenase PreA subunit
MDLIIKISIIIILIGSYWVFLYNPCTGNMTWNKDSAVCECSDPEYKEKDGTCVERCPDKNTEWNKDSAVCECSDPEYKLEDGTCIERCPDKNKVWNKDSAVCECLPDVKILEQKLDDPALFTSNDNFTELHAKVKSYGIIINDIKTNNGGYATFIYPDIKLDGSHRFKFRARTVRSGSGYTASYNFGSTNDYTGYFVQISMGGSPYGDSARSKNFIIKYNNKVIEGTLHDDDSIKSNTIGNWEIVYDKDSKKIEIYYNNTLHYSAQDIYRQLSGPFVKFSIKNSGGYIGHADLLSPIEILDDIKCDIVPAETELFANYS